MYCWVPSKNSCRVKPRPLWWEAVKWVSAVTRQNRITLVVKRGWSRKWTHACLVTHVPVCKRALCRNAESEAVLPRRRPETCRDGQLVFPLELGLPSCGCRSWGFQPRWLSESRHGTAAAREGPGAAPVCRSCGVFPSGEFPWPLDGFNPPLMWRLGNVVLCYSSSVAAVLYICPAFPSIYCLPESSVPSCSFCYLVNIRM